eukprot:11097800-Alexandrium_andersonii.AAC.1
MSASLVGSEMCIRDSTAWQRPSASRLTAGRRRTPGWRCRFGTGRSVSYTHLTLPTICSV